MHIQIGPLMRRRLDATIAELSGEFRGVFSRETVARYVEESFVQLGDRPTIGPNFLPLIIERFTRERLSSVAQSWGKVHKALPEVLFVCERNAGRSQIAAALADRLSHGWVAVRSAGSLPDERIDPVVVEAVDAIGVDAVYCGGDLVGYGSHPNQVCALIEQREIPTTIYGNYDYAIGRDLADRGCAYVTQQDRELGQQSVAWTLAHTEGRRPAGGVRRARARRRRPRSGVDRACPLRRAGGRS